jgi:hypothetical protein
MPKSTILNVHCAFFGRAAKSGLQDLTVLLIFLATGQGYRQTLWEKRT